MRHFFFAILLAALPVLSFADTWPGCATTLESLEPALPVDAPVGPRLSASRVPDTSPGCLSEEHFFLFEDVDGVLLDPARARPEMGALMVAAANELIAAQGDRYDFIGFLLDFEPADQLGGAFYRGVRNDATGFGVPLFDNHASLGISGTRLQGMIQMHDMAIARQSIMDTALLHEFSHRWLFFLNQPLPGGQVLARGAHVECRTDIQGGMHGQEWRGESPARVRGGLRNQDTRESFGWVNLYLMGLASGEELEQGSAELRWMDNSRQPDGRCETPYEGIVSDWTLDDLVATYGERQPAVGAAQTDFRAGWIVIHAPGTTVRRNHLARFARLLERFDAAWVEATLGRSRIRHQLFDDANCDGSPD